MRTIVKALRSELEANNRCTIAVIVESWGSTPRTAGAMMLVGEHGRLAGSIGGGAGEGSAIRSAQKCIVNGENGVLNYNLGAKKQDPGQAPICGGSMRVFFQVVEPEEKTWMALVEEVEKLLANGGSEKLVFHSESRTPELYLESGERVIGSATESRGERFEFLIETKKRAIIFGCGHCGQALLPMLKMVDFRVIMYDYRPEFANYDVVPGADEIICAPFDRIADVLTLHEDDYLVVMTSGHEFDYICEKQLVQLPHAYLGVMGSKRKIAYVTKKLLDDGIPQELIDTVHKPIGVDIKADSPSEIAVSVTGEMIRVRAEEREKCENYRKKCPSHD